MKKIFLTSFSGICLLTFFIANGQLASTHTQASRDFAPFEKSVSKGASVDRNTVDSRVIKNFVRLYKNVSNEQWFKLQDGFVSMFSFDDIDYQVAYGKKGNWLHTIRSYHEAKLSRDIRHIVKSTYYDFEINRIQEIERPGNPVTYIIQLIGKTELINLRISDGEIEALQKFNKSE